MLGDIAAVHAFVDDYRAAFEAFDVAATAAFFSYPCQITGGEPRSGETGPTATQTTP
jgi:hypothetical protein